MCRDSLLRQIALVTLCLYLLSGCGLVDRVSEVLYPPTPTAKEPPTTAPLAPEPSATAWPADTPTVPPTAASPPEPLSPPTPEVREEQQLVYAMGGIIYRGDYLGREVSEVASVPQLEAWDFAEGMLAIARGRSLEIIDLYRGSLYGAQIETEADVAYSQVLWSTSGKSLLYATTVSAAEGQDTSSTGRHVDIRVLAFEGSELGQIRINDVTAINPLYYDDVLGRVLLVPMGSDGALNRVEYRDLDTGEVVASMTIAGQNEVLVSPDGRYLLTESFDEAGAKLNIYDLGAEGGVSSKSWAHPKGTFSVSHVWSPDGRYVAYLLQEGSPSDPRRSLGVWRYELANEQARQILEESSLASSLVGWTPGGTYIIGHHRGEGGVTYFYAIRPDGGDRQILGLGADAHILGWMQPVQKAVPKVVVDAWHVRFMDAEKDPQLMADLAAQFIVAHAEEDTDTVAQQLAKYMRESGWPLRGDQPKIIRLTDDLAVAQLPPFSIHVLYQGAAQLLANGDVLLDARLQGDDLGIIFGWLDGNAVQPAFLLSRHQPDGSFVPVWTPQGQRDWIVTDGEIVFVGEGLNILQVRGSSFGLDVGEDAIFVECRACPHRWLSARWVRDGDRYLRQTEVDVGASLIEVLWSMTERRPYAILYETLRRLRQEASADKVASAKAIEQAKTLGLLDPTMRLVAEEETKDSVRFSDVQREVWYLAQVKGGTLVRIERLQE